MKNYKIYQIILLLTPFVFSFAFGLDIYIPVVPQMEEIFETTPALIHLTLSLFLFTTGFGQLFIGPLADRYGRKVVFYFASLFFLIGSLLCSISPSIAWLILGRFICALGACGMLVTSFAVIRDLYSEKEIAKMYSFLNGAIGISPTFAPMIGSFLSILLGWQSIFLFLALIGCITLLITYFFIKETLPSQNRVQIDRQIFLRYWKIYTNKSFLKYTLISGIAEGVFFCFFSISPFIIIDLLNFETQQFSYFFAVFGLVIAIGGFVSGKLIEKIGSQATILLGIVLTLIGGILVLLWYYFTGLSLFGFLFPMVVACTGAMFIISSCAGEALEPFELIAGTAAAAYGALQFAISSLIGSLLMLAPLNSTIPYGISIVLCAIFSFLFYLKNESARGEELAT